MLNLVISWFVDLTFQAPMQYCSLQHQTLLLSPSTTRCCFCFGSISLFFLELFLHSSSGASRGPYRLWEFIFQCHTILPFHTVYGVLKARILKWFAIPFSSGPHLSELSTMIRRLGWPYTAWLSFIDLARLWSV